ncbi:MAG: death on curing protein [Acetobacteraceae bacterium]|jgi:death-on-curing protein|nr:death on curing protein [Acetobacteraceae bacterium]MEA2787926.1 death on curing protein [Acetobacteraceae bacterium]
MTEWRWIDPMVVQAVHDSQLAEHGGMEGVRDQGLIESALARPRNLAPYGDPDAAELAAAYAYGIAKNHGFVDGNKRTGWVIARLFLADNGYTVSFDRAEMVRTMVSLMAGTIDETAMTEWLRVRIRAI